MDSPADGKERAGQEPASKKSAATGKRKIALWSACALWGLSIVLSFSIPPTSALIWLPDTILLLGFIPLILICPYSLIWIAFGSLTSFIGFFLLTLIGIPDSALPAQTLPVKKHLYEYHPSWSWLIIGLFVTVCGSIRLLVNGALVLFGKKRKQ